ncbi:uncharacterized protein LOC127837054 isoform X2 [Dreissena polymorpha]|uniref:uncharacterized protein LOC127837054 isoform X2 n=1 Tax=Dreissena polymorpha TaxID=45954 RepID=UPI002264101C|nr:uncharacterized protein LOC127837054 isoform X2 [Dreissena polymorpha]
MSDCPSDVSKEVKPVNHPNFIPEHDIKSLPLFTENADVRTKPPSGVNGNNSDGASKPKVGRSISHDYSCDQKNRGSVGSFGSCDSKNYDEEVVIAYQDEAINVEEQGTGNTCAGTDKGALRLVLVSGKVRNTTAVRNALQPNVAFVQYKYYTSSLEGILDLVSRTLGPRKCISVALILSCSGLSLQLCGKEEKMQLLNKESITEMKSIRDFFVTLVDKHLDVSDPGARLDFMACSLFLHTDGGSIDKEMEALLKIPVKMYKDLGGNEAPRSASSDDGNRTNGSVGDQYFKLEKLRGWSGQQQQTLAGFEKIKIVGKGAYGAAVLYKKKDDDSLVILKEINMHDLKATERQMALNEVNILAMLEHPNIISYFDSFEEDGVIMIEMEYAEGGTLARYLASQEKSLEERDIIVMFQQIVSAIRHIHEHNILHRDLKTANIFLTKECVVKVGDFGISKMMSTANKGANTVLGTPYYISPEMCEGKPYNDKSDIWALGCILYEMACLQKTFEGTNLPALVNKIMKGQFAPVKGNYSQEFKDLIMLMLSQDPAVRPSAQDLLHTLIPQLLSQYEEVTTTDNDEDLDMTKDKVNSSKKKTRAILYYFDSSSAELTPIELNPKVKIRATAVGADHVIVVTMESQVFTWGEGSKGQLGHGDCLSVSKPKNIEALSGKSITRACCGDGFSVFASDRGIVLTCGDGSQGCLGHSDWSAVNRPRLIESLLSVDVISVACGPAHVVVVGSKGEIFSWGNGVSGRLGLGTEDNHCKPMKVTVTESVLIREVFCGHDGTMFLTDEGCVCACGNNEENKLGLNHRCGFIAAMRNIFTRTEVEGQKVPTMVRALRHRVIDISMGRYHTAVIVEPGTVWTFGRNSEGQLGIEETKPVRAPVKVNHMTDKNIVRVQCGEHYTVASTNMNEIYYWGLRFKHTTLISPATNDMDSSIYSRNKDDMRVESVTPRNAGHGRQPSSTSGISIPSLDGNSLTDHENDLEAGNKAEWESVADSGYAGDSTVRTGFRPLSSVPRRSSSATSRDMNSQREKDLDSGFKDDSEIIFPPDHLMRIVSTDETLTLSSFFCHGENIFIQVETTAPPPRKKTRKKRAFRKRYSGSTLPVPSSNTGTSASSREGGDEYSSGTSEVDTQGTVPSWLRKELADTQNGANPIVTKNFQGDESDGNMADNTSEQSDEDHTHKLIDTSMSSIQINRELTPCKLPLDKALTPKNSDLKSSSFSKGSSGDGKTGKLSSTESEIDAAMHSDGSAKDLKMTSRAWTELQGLGKGLKSGGLGSGTQRVKSAALSTQWTHNRFRQNRGHVRHDTVLKEQLSARGFVSDVTVKRREEALLGELKMTREEKMMAEMRLRELERDHMQRQEQLRLESEQRALEREKQLQSQIEMLKQELKSQTSQLKENQKKVMSLQDQLSIIQTKKKSFGPGRVGSTSESKVCVLQ